MADDLVVTPGHPDETHVSDSLTPEADSTEQTDPSISLVVQPDGESETGTDSALPFPVVGIGGSAGSLEPFTEVFQKLPTNTGMAFVVVLHLLPNQQSHLPEILQRHTTMAVLSIKEGMVPEPNKVYVIPPNALVFLRREGFHLESRPATGPFLPVNDLFQSIASVQRNLSLGVILSGMDGDGAIGLRAIKGEGGFAIVQAPESARHSGMPTSSIENDHVDLILPPGEIAAHLADLARSFGEVRWVQATDAESSTEGASELARILKLLRGVSGVDFTLYKPSTIQRRIARRMVMQRTDTLSDYMLLLQTDGAELRALQEDILISVTQFFRDPEVFEELQSTLIPQIFAGKRSDQQVRVWVAGCSTGEEVYSLAICMLEHIASGAIEPGIQIFGTDASEGNIQRARLGIFPQSITNEVSPERLRRFFTKTEKGYQINKRVRDLCIFARQNLCTDPPFSHLDLVSCRNVLIYFGAELQRRVLATFHYALQPQGHLLLGRSESIRDYSSIFTTVDRDYKLFVSVETPDRRSSLTEMGPRHFLDHLVHRLTPTSGETQREFDLSGLADRAVLARYGPPGVIVNERMEILQTRGRTSPFLEMSPGSASLTLPRMLRKTIASEVVAALSRAIQTQLPVQLDNLRVTEDDESIEAKLEILPLIKGSSGYEVRFYLVSFLLPTQYTGFAPPVHMEAGDGMSVAQLQHDLASNRLYLNSLLDEREATNQDLISANEEIQSANEELQSTNEELETTKEELQSSNEELQTVNDELQDRNEHLSRVGNDLTNLLNSVHLPVLMLSSDLLIRHFTPQCQKLMNLRPQDVGRPFSEIRLNLEVDDLERRMLEVLETLAPQEIEVQDRDSRWHFLRIRPYRTTDNKIEGLVLVLVDIDHSRRSQQELRDARDFAASIIANTPLPLVVVNAEFCVVYLNDAFCDLTKLSRQVINSRPVTEIAATLWNMADPLRALLRDVVDNRGVGGSFQCESKGRDDVRNTLLVQARPLQPDGERFSIVTFQDISAHKQVERLLQGEGERLATEVAQTTRELDRSRQELRALTDMLITTQEDERRRLARELHDDVSQRLALLDMECETALKALESDPAQSRGTLQELRAEVASISDDVRTLSHRLHPSILEHLGAAAALESLLDEFSQREGMMTTFYAEDLSGKLPLDVATGLYRITQEALRNIAKHAGKAHVKVSLQTADGQLMLEIADSGRGFNQQQEAFGLGLVSMKERARLLGAAFAIQSAPRRGTTVTVSVPAPTPQLSEPSQDSEVSPN